MQKIFTIAIREYRAMVATKAFLISIVMMPLLMLGGLFAMQFVREAGAVTERRIEVFDPQGDYFLALQSAASILNAGASNLTQPIEPEDQKSKDPENLNSDSSKRQSKEMLGIGKEKYQFERIVGDEFTDEMSLELSRRVKAQELYAFIVIPKDVDRVPELQSLVNGTNEIPKVLFYAQDASLSDARMWISEVINGIVRAKRFWEVAKLNPEQVQRLSMQVPVVGMGMVTKAADGSISAKVENNPMSAIFLPMGVMMLMFMVIFMAAQPALESVLEEKSQRIAEVLLGSASPLELMSGKLLGTVAGSLTVFVIYLAGAWVMAMYRSWTDHVPLSLIPWFIIFQVLGVLFYASIFLAVGASVSQLKEAQSLLLPVWMLMMSPMFIWIFIIRNPQGNLSTYFSLFPPATPTTMMLRMATGQTIPIWQPFLGVVLLLISTFGIVLLASRIFRVGILWQGKTPKIGEIIRWAFTG
jgi:ABC-type Na+ efflux pump permease subunit